MRRLAVLALLLQAPPAASSPRLRDCPNCAPVPVVGSLPWFRATTVAADGAIGFAVSNSPRFKNRPLYSGAWDGGLVLSGDRPVTHLADDAAIYGGLLLGLRRGPRGGGGGGGGAAVWLHNFSAIDSSFAGGAVRWSARDDGGPLAGLSVRAAVYAAADGVGFVLDANVTDAGGGGGGGGGGAELIWAFGCGAPQSSAVGWANDPLINVDTLQWVFTPAACKGNAVALDYSANLSLTTRFAPAHTVSVRLATTAASSSLAVADAGSWQNISQLLGDDDSEPPAPRGAAPRAAAPRAKALPIPGASLWLRAASLAPSLANGSAVAAWADESAGGATLSQAAAALQPHYFVDGLGAGQPAVRFDGAATFLEAAGPRVGAASTMFAVLRDDGSTTNCCSGVLFFNDSFNGISTLVAPGAADDDDGGQVAAGAPIVTTLDYAGSPAYGHANIRGRAVVAASVYTASGPSYSAVDGCTQYTASVAGTPSGAAGGVMVGRRFVDMPDRYFRGVIGEIVVFPRALNASELAAMHAYLYAAWPSVVPKRACAPSGLGPLAVGRSPLQASATTRFTWAVQANAAPPADALAVLAAAQARAQRLAARATSLTPDALVDAGLQAMSFAVDGLFRATPGAFVHGAMAWDSLYLGWRSEVGATVLGAPEQVAQEGRYFMAQQILSSPNAACRSNPAHRYTDEAGDSRFHGAGRIDVAGSIYDMQSLFFDQQIHLWRWTGNATHEALLRPALKLHDAWARAAFDSDGNGLFSSYTNTWPTDSQWYNGGETQEETALMLRVSLALRDMALRAGNASEAAEYAARAAQIRASAAELWIVPRGIPAASREEGGHRRLRPDPWLYSIFLPIEARLWAADGGDDGGGAGGAEAAAQALFFSEVGLERDAIFCEADASASNATCGAVVWTSNWVPSMWSVRQLWSGDNSGLALAYFLTGMADDGYTVLRGNMRRDMLQSAVPGMSGGSNGGTDFNDAVHPTARALVEGLFGLRPDYAAGVVTVAPQVPSAWPSMDFASADAKLAFRTDFATAVSLTVTLARPAPVLVLRLPLRAAALVSLAITGTPPGAVVTNYTEAGFGEAVLVVRVAAGGDLVAGVEATAAIAGALPCVPAIYASATEGRVLELAPPPGLTLANFSDPQGALVGAALAGGRITGTPAAGSAGWHLVFGYAVTTAGALPQVIQFKLNVSAANEPPPLLPPRAPAAAGFTFVPLGAAANGDLRDIFKEDAYLSPRPETCAVRIGSDGWSAWTFPYWGGPWAPQADFANVPNLTVAGGAIATPQGAQFMLSANASDAAPRGAINAAYTTLWDTYPANVSVPVAASAAAGATGVWVLLAGSTNPMQTRIANAELRLRYADASADVLELVPPENYWALSGWGRNDYDYETDAFCLPPAPPPTVQLGANNRAMVYFRAVAAGKILAAVELEAMSQEVVVALLAVSVVA